MRRLPTLLVLAAVTALSCQQGPRRDPETGPASAAGRPRGPREDPASARGDAEPGPPGSRSVGGVTRAVLPNGMTVIVEEIRSRPVVALSLNVIGGSRDETPEEQGGAHF
ncbi:MAG: hypothetical protein L0216_10390, partial [Planctomycetales bacterium]|nr:hypothetical protein [Planctomycetales bacterium]